VTVLEDVFESWKIIPKAAVESFEREIFEEEKESFLQKLGRYVEKYAGKHVKKAAKVALRIPIKFYSFLLELPGEALFFWGKPYWRYSILAIWRFYWALALNKVPFSTDLAIVAALYYRTNDFLDAARNLAEELNKSKDWEIDEEAIARERFPVKPDQKIEPETLRFLRFAAYDLVDLYLRDDLPFICLAHHKVHWAGCPVCEKKN